MVGSDTFRKKELQSFNLKQLLPFQPSSRYHHHHHPHPAYKHPHQQRHHLQRDLEAQWFLNSLTAKDIYIGQYTSVTHFSQSKTFLITAINTSALNKGQVP